MFLECDVGQRLYLKGRFYKAADVAHPTVRVPADPTAVVLTVKRPDGELERFDWPAPGDITRDAVGVFHREYIVTIPGKYGLRFAGVGDVTAPAETEVIVRESRIA